MQTLIIGSGLAGLTAAIKASQLGDKVTLITKESDHFNSASAWAQGGIVYKSIDDTPSDLVKDIVLASNGMVKKEAVQFLAQEGPAIVKKFLLDEVQIPFVKDSKTNEFLLTKEGAHSKNRILFSHDQTGRVIIENLVRYLKTCSNVEVLFKHLVVDIITVPHHSLDRLAVYEKVRCIGAYVLEDDANVKKIFADKVVLAAGGIGSIYEYTTNPPPATGDGIALAYRAGARIINMEFTQFHPTTLALKGANNFLITEALRGEGAIILNKDGKDFISNYDSRGSLASRDIVARAIAHELNETDNDHVYLSIEKCHFNVKKRFPQIYATCLQHKIDVTKEWIPIMPAFHFSCGGILTDLDGKTNVKNLFAIGENACTGVHGANRLASTSLLEAITFANQAAECRVKKNVYQKYQKSIADWQFASHKKQVEKVWIRQENKLLRSLMWNYVGIIRKTSYLETALEKLKNQKNAIDDAYRKHSLSKQLVELRNSNQTAILVASSAIKNKHSMGCHYRVD